MSTGKEIRNVRSGWIHLLDKILRLSNFSNNPSRFEGERMVYGIFEAVSEQQVMGSESLADSRVAHDPCEYNVLHDSMTASMIN